ncbi:MAG: TatD family hydrolase [Zestosphaera sp.]
MFPVSDAHAHVSPAGLGGSLVGRKFREAGGWFIALVSLPPTNYGLRGDLNGLLKSFDIHARECLKARSEGLSVACLAGVHPAYVDELVRAVGVNRVDEVLSMVRRALESLRRLRLEGLIEGFGEFGRPHYKTLPESVVVNDVVLREVLEVCSDTDSVLHLHTEQGGSATVASVDALVKSAGASKCRVVFHHASLAVVRAAENLGYHSTVLGREDLLLNILELNPSRVLVESDFIDDPRRPGVVMYPWDLAGEVGKLLAKEGGHEEALRKCLVDNVRELYGVKPET